MSSSAIENIRKEIAEVEAEIRRWQTDSTLRNVSDFDKVMNNFNVRLSKLNSELRDFMTDFRD
jgi:hypothetical protein